MRPGSVVVDAGANIGDHTIEFRRVGRELNVRMRVWKKSTSLSESSRSHRGTRRTWCAARLWTVRHSSVLFQSQDNVRARILCRPVVASVNFSHWTVSELQDVWIMEGRHRGTNAACCGSHRDSDGQSMLEVSVRHRCEAGDDFQGMDPDGEIFTTQSDPLRKDRSFADPELRHLLCSGASHDDQ